jgi:hypothetical protein
MEKSLNLSNSLMQVRDLIEDQRFNQGLFYRPNYVSYRVYLDTPEGLTNTKDSQVLTFSYSYINALSICTVILEKEYFVCLVISSEKDKITRYDRSKLKSCSIKPPKDKIVWSYYCEDDELFKHHIFYKDTIEVLPNYILRSICPGLSTIGRSCGADIFLASINTNQLLNIYDDRGMDILTRDASINLDAVATLLSPANQLMKNLNLIGPEVEMRKVGG